MKARRGFTLLEVVVALVLMGSVLVGSLLALSKHRKQLSMAEKRIEAAMIADQLVHQLVQQQGGIPINTQGRVAGEPEWIWQSSQVGMTTLANVPLSVVRFQIIDRSSTPISLVSVHVVEAVRE